MFSVSQSGMLTPLSGCAYASGVALLLVMRSWCLASSTPHIPQEGEDSERRDTVADQKLPMEAHSYSSYEVGMPIAIPQGAIVARGALPCRVGSCVATFGPDARLVPE